MATVPERQAAKLPDAGSTGNSDADQRRRRRAMIAGLMTSPQGVTGAANTSAATLG